MRNLTWGEVRFTVYERSEKLKIEVRDYKETFSFAEIGGLLNRRRGASPNRLWRHLCILAKCDGNISWDEDFDPRAYGCTKVAYSELRKWLRGLTRIKGDPFEPYHKAMRASRAKRGAYKAKFHIKLALST